MKHLVFLLVALIVFTSVTVASAHAPEKFVEFIDPEKIELFQKFNRLDVLPPSFHLEHMDELLSKDDGIALITSIANWGEELTINRTTSVFSRGFKKVKRFFGRINLSPSINKKLEGRENESILKGSSRWGLKIGNIELDNIILGFEMLEYEFIVLSKMLEKSSIPRTLMDEFEWVRKETQNLELEFDVLKEKNHHLGDNIFGVDDYEKTVWVYYLLSIQHDLLPGNIIGENFNDRRSPQVLLNNELTMYKILLYAEKMIDYVDSLSAYSTGFSDKAREIEEDALKVSRLILSTS